MMYVMQSITVIVLCICQNGLDTINLIGFERNYIMNRNMLMHINIDECENE